MSSQYFFPRDILAGIDDRDQSNRSRLDLQDRTFVLRDTGRQSWFKGDSKLIRSSYRTVEHLCWRTCRTTWPKFVSFLYQSCPEGQLMSQLFQRCVTPVLERCLTPHVKLFHDIFETIRNTASLLYQSVSKKPHDSQVRLKLCRSHFKSCM